MWMRWIDRLEQWLISLGFALATLLLFTNVMLRYLFDSGLIWALELVQYLFAWVVLIGAAHGVKHGIHLGVDILLRRFKPPLRRYLTLFALLCCLLFSLSVLLLSLEYSYLIWQWGDRSQDLQIPQWIPYMAIPIGSFLMSLHLFVIGAAIWRGERLAISRSSS